MSSLDLGIIGNGAVAALVTPQAEINWLCLPRLDGEPVFNALLGGQGRFAIELENCAKTEQHYVTNTAIIETILTDKMGGQICISDFCPRFESRGRRFRPMSIVRQVKVLHGSPRITVRVRAEQGWGKSEIRRARGVSHITFEGDDLTFRLTTDAPIDHVLDEQTFNIDKGVTFILGPDESVAENLADIGNEWLSHTRENWQKWSRSLAVPFEWQEPVIRAAITLAMCVYEETGGIVAALTTSIPEHEGSERNWDYRFCWMRDAYFTVTALNRLASIETMEYYIRFVRNIVASTAGDHIQPVFGIGLETDLTEHIEDNLPGYRDHPPVRRGNQAAEHIQHDVYGQVILSVSQAFFDKRLLSRPTEQDYLQLEKVGERAYKLYNTPDAGIWEFRGKEYVHTSSAMMCWAACDRLGKIAKELGKPMRESYWAAKAEEIKACIFDKAYNEEIKSFTAAFGGEVLDASVLLMAEIGMIAFDDERYVNTVLKINEDLREGNQVFRYKMEDDFGTPETAFIACTFWLIDALHRIGHCEEARDMYISVLGQRNSLGLLSEDIVPETQELWGNFPQTYSLVGIINSAHVLSMDWREIV